VKFVALQAKHWNWIAERAKPSLCEDTKGVVAEDDFGKILAAAVFDSWSYNACSVHIAIDSPMVLRHGFVDALKDYVFNQSGRKMVLGFTPADNKRALKFNNHVGMKEIYRLKDGYKDGVDFVVTQMTKDDAYGSR
jgi:hypothetical protein